MLVKERLSPCTLAELGFEAEHVHRISLFDRLASDDLIRMVFTIQKSQDEVPDPALLLLVHHEIDRVRTEIAHELSNPSSRASDLVRLIEKARRFSPHRGFAPAPWPPLTPRGTPLSSSVASPMHQGLDPAP